MAGRGHGRGWGGRGRMVYVPPKPFVLYPEEVNCPGKIDINDDYMKNLLSWSSKFQRYWKASPYLLEERTSKDESRKMHIERYSDRKRTMFTRDSLSQVLMFDNFPKELTQGTSKRMASRKNFQWNPEANLEKKLDFFEQKEKRNKGREDEDEDEKKDDEDEKKDDEDEDEIADNEESDDDFGGDDYNQGEYHDDDEDDYNFVDEGEDIF